MKGCGNMSENQEPQSNYGFTPINEFINSLETIDELPDPPQGVEKMESAEVEKWVDVALYRYFADQTYSKIPTTKEKHKVLRDLMVHLVEKSCRSKINPPNFHYIYAMLLMYQKCHPNFPLDPLRFAFLLGYTYSEFWHHAENNNKEGSS